MTRPVYAPVASPAPPSPATHQSATSSEIVPQLQNIVRFVAVKCQELFSTYRLQYGEHGGEVGSKEDCAAREERRIQPKAICCCHHED